MEPIKRLLAQAIIQLFETSHLDNPTSYGKVTNVEGDAGGLSYGKSQASLNSGNLYFLLKDYVDKQGVQAAAIAPFLPRLLAKDSTVGSDSKLVIALRLAGGDVIMKRTQDDFFDRAFWLPAVEWCRKRGFVEPLTHAVVYDGWIHGFFGGIVKRVNANLPEREWVESYIKERRAWLAGQSEPLNNCVYRMDTFMALTSAGNWGLEPPFQVRDKLLKALGLDEVVAVSASSVRAYVGDNRLLRLTTPHLCGDDVSNLQRLLVRAGFSIAPDGDFGDNTDQALRDFQTKRGLKADGICGPATLQKLEE
jgi:chitosanase